MKGRGVLKNLVPWSWLPIGLGVLFSQFEMTASVGVLLWLIGIGMQFTYVIASFVGWHVN